MRYWIPLLLATMGLSLFADICPIPKVERAIPSAHQHHQALKAPDRFVESSKSAYVACTLNAKNTIHFQVIGQGVAPVNTISPAQAMALAKRAAIADAYRQLGEKICGVRVEGRDLIRNMMISRSTVRTQIDALIRNAKILDTKFKDGLYEVEMEVTVRGDEWYPRLAR